MKRIKQINNYNEKYILNLVKNEFPIIRKRQYSNKYFLNSFRPMILIVGNHFQYAKYHYKYIHQIYSKWVSKNIFERAYIDFIKNNYLKLKHFKNQKH